MKEDHKENRRDQIDKMAIDETMRQSLGNGSLDENFCILGVL